MSTAISPELDVLLLGDSGVGKSTFLSRLSAGVASPTRTLPALRDTDDPFHFEITFSSRRISLNLHHNLESIDPSSSRPSLLVLCYAIPNASSLNSVRIHWKPLVDKQFNLDETLPVLLLGLQRDARQEIDYGGRVQEDRNHLVHPQEGLGAAQEMRCDKYMECSALTGELCDLVFEDIAKTAAMTLTGRGGQSAGWQCSMS